MSHREAYSYTILRYVHDVVTGEFVNVGVVVHAKSGLRSKFRTTHGRVSSVFPGLNKKAFKASLAAVKAAIKDVQQSEASAGMFQLSPDAMTLACKALVADDSSFQWSPAGSGITRDAAATVEQLFDRFVTRHEKQTSRGRNEADVWRPIREKLEELNVADRFKERTFNGSDDEITFDHAWKNGRWHAIEPVSLDLLAADDIRQKAHRLRGHLDSVADAISDNLSLNLVVARPASPELADAYEAALKILGKATVRPSIIEENAAAEFVAALADEILAHDGHAVS